MQTTHHAHANFKRKEKKYVLNQGEYLALMGLIGEKLEEDEYAYSHIESLYYDTPDWRMINRSMEKPLYKEKLRVRVYGTMGETQSADPDQVAFVELKKKFKGIVYKRRMAMSLQGALAFMDGMDYEEAMAAYPATSKDLELEATWRDRQIAAEIRACIDRWQPLAPAMIIAVDRMSLRTNDGSGVRMTFDDLFSQYTSKAELAEAKTTNMGALYQLTYDITLKDATQEKALLDALRTRNGNLQVSCGRPVLAKERL